MFRSMRRSRQQLENDETIKILRSGTTGVLGLTGDDGYPYTVPINYVYENGKIYFHGARSGHKYDSIKSHDKVSLCVIEKEDIIKEELTTYFRSVQVFGKAHIVTDEEERQRAFRAFCERYCSDDMDRYDEIMAKEAKAALIVCVDIEHISGKEAMELVKQRG